MSTLTSTSTLADVKAAYFDNASYQEDNDPAKARAFVTACRFLLLMLPSKSMHGRGGSVELDVSQVAQQQALARSWLASHPSVSPDVIHSSFGNFRDYPPGSGFPGPFC